ncbi:MAG: S9 family peptidase [Pseudomonadota bacterium]|nr:S9 family peptidase [Pseudomonadota bacterium]
MRLSLIAIATLLSSTMALAQAPPTIPISAFAALPSIKMPRVSPDGQRVAAVSVARNISQIMLFRPDESASKTTMVRIGELPITDVRWAGNSRLLVQVIATGRLMGVEVPMGRLLVVDVSTGGVKVADKKSRGIYGGEILYTDPTGTHALVASQDDVMSSPSVKRIDLATGDTTVVEKERANIWDWVADSTGVVRGGFTYQDGRWTLWYRGRAGEPLRPIRGKAANNQDSSVDRMIFGKDGASSMIVTNEKSDRFGVYDYDVETGGIGKLLFESPIADISEVLIDPRTLTLAGVQYHDDRQRTFWFDPKLKKLQDKLDQAIPGQVNEIVDPGAEHRSLIRSTGASRPPSYFLLDRKTLTMTKVLEPYDRIDPAHLAPVKPVHFTARDGLRIPAYLTLPVGRDAKKLPLIVLPHGGPFARDEWAYDPIVQFLANRGYAVLQPQFRGSTGYGRAFVAKGSGQWGRGMQDDLDDGVDWLATGGIIDPARVCVVGGSYGGYAALWGVIRNPERYRCAASSAGVTDLRRQLRENRKSFSATRYFREWRTKVAGEGKFDLDLVSPLAQADRLKRPVLIVHGEKDRTVVARQGHDMVKALRKNGADVTSAFYPEGGHDFDSSEDFANYLELLEAFLRKHNPAS